jgi:hypothetical protein
MMESLLAILGMLFFIFLILAAAVEVILEVFRGVLERFGITWVKGKISLEDALKFADQFAPGNSDLNIKLQAVKSAAEQISEKANVKLKVLDDIKTKLGESGVNMTELVSELNAVASSVKIELEKSERQRVFALRTLAAIIGCLLTWVSGFHVFKILAASPEAKGVLEGSLETLNYPWVNILVGGLAAAAGSSYWHDKLDRVRNLKSVAQELKKLAS